MAKVLSGSILYYTHIHHIEWDRIQLAKSLSFVRKSHFMTGWMGHSAPQNGGKCAISNVSYIRKWFTGWWESNFFLAHYRVQIKFFNLYDAWVNTIYSIVESFISIIQKHFVKFSWKSTVVVVSLCKFNLEENYEM